MANINEQYIFQAKEILRMITGSGLEGYIVGESLRDLVLDREIKEVEIFTNLTKEKVLNLFKDYQCKSIDDYTIALDYLGYHFIISSAHEYTLGAKIKINTQRRHYSTSLMDFLEQKLFSINTLAMGNNNVIYDCYNGRIDLNKKRLRMICENVNTVFTNDPIRILQAIRLVSELGYRLDKDIYRAMRRKSKFLKNAPLDKVTIEMAKILTGKYAKKGFRLLIKSKAYKRLPYFKYEIKRLNDSFKKEDVETFMAISLVRAKTYIKEIGSIFSDEVDFQSLCNLAITNPKSNYDVLTLYSFGLNKCVKANYINYLCGKCKKKNHQIIKAYNKLSIKKTCDLAFKGEDILELTKNDPTKYALIEELLDQIIAKVLNNELKNDYNEISHFANNYFNKLNKEENDITSNVSPVNTIEVEEKQEESETNNHNEEIVSDNMNNPYATRTLNYDTNNFDTDNKAPKQENPYDYENLVRHQEELDRRLYELEIQNLEKDIELEIEKKIKLSGLLEGLTGTFRESTYETLRKVYYDVLINTDKYTKLRNTGEKNG